MLTPIYQIAGSFLRQTEINMKKNLLLSILLLAGIGFVSAQSKAQIRTEKRATYYAEAAAEQFGLNKKKQEKVYETKLAQMKANQSLSKRKKNGEFEDEEAFKAERQETMKPYAVSMLELTGATRKDFRAFNKRLNEEMKDIQ